MTDARTLGTHELHEVSLLRCPEGCGHWKRATLPPKWEQDVEAGFPIPIVGCGNPWHYTNFDPSAAKADTLRSRVAALEEALEGLVRKMAPHSGSCCDFAEDGTVIVTPESCKCGPVERAAHEVLDWYGTTWKRGTRPSGAAAARALATPDHPFYDHTLPDPLALNPATDEARCGACGEPNDWAHKKPPTAGCRLPQRSWSVRVGRS